MPQYALIAEHVTNVNPDLLVRDDSCEVCYGVLRCSERNVIERVSRRAPQAPRTTGDNLAFGAADRSGCRGPSGSQRSRATEQDCSANVPNGYSVSRHRRGFGGRQSLTNRPRYSRHGCGDRIRLRFWRIVFTSSADFPKTAGRQTDLNSRTFTPRGFFPSSGAAANWINTAGKEGKNHRHLIRKQLHRLLSRLDSLGLQSRRQRKQLSRRRLCRICHRRQVIATHERLPSRARPNPRLMLNRSVLRTCVELYRIQYNRSTCLGEVRRADSRATQPFKGRNCVVSGLHKLHRVQETANRP